MATNLLAALPGAASPVDSFNQGRNNALLGQAMTALPDQRNNLLGQVAMTDPRQASAFKDEYAQQDQQEQANQDARMKKLAGAANYLLTAYKSGNPAQTEGAYQAVRPYLNQLGQELGQGPASPHFTEEMLPHLYQIVGQAGGDTAINGQVPTGLRELQGQIAGAGLTAGSPEAQKAYRVALGLDPRAVTGAAKTGMITGADGRERPYTFDPSTGRYSVFDGGAWQPLGAQESEQLDAAGAGGTMMGNPSTGSMPKPTVAALMQQATQMANQGGPGKNQAAAQQWLYGQLDHYGYRPATSTTAGLGVGRPPEETARATQDAKNASDLAYLPQTEQIKTDAAVDRAGRETTATANAKNSAEQAQAMQQRRADAIKTLSDLDEVDRLLPQATGGALGKTMDSTAAAFNRTTEGAQASAQLDILAGRLTSAVPRMQGPQSDRDVELYQKQAGDLANRNLPIATRQAAAQELRRLQLKYLDNPYGNGSPMPTSIPAQAAGNGSGIQAGHVEGGYRFKGGDPGNQANWEKM